MEQRSPSEPGRESRTGDPEPGSAGWWAKRAAAARKSRPRAGGLSSGRIVDAALEILREGGLEALTLRAVASRLGLESNGSLYRHIASRDELIVLMVDRVMADVRLDRTGLGWRADVEALLWEMRRVMLDQPLPATASRSRSTYGPSMLRIVDSALGLFLEAGLTGEQAAYATTTMIQYVAGATTIERSDAGRRSHGARGSAGFDELLGELPAGEFSALRAAGAVYVAAPADEVFRRGMTMLLDGVTNQLREACAPTGQDL